ncbi:hypothetical protein K435DRAFT_964527 [Dendrothele bispora CBS 962.96]|uniref:Glycoside hydrolase family 92 protein n=1 Tax=Dendrothele bispora (strain CBS 962.96) TaxID=1314807 RepID=A0A4S8MAP0_DENBC|nr:hypothetical protein K435DRAFT_964527 [Dendrothele bispora CBS 962.96]
MSRAKLRLLSLLCFTLTLSLPNAATEWPTESLKYVNPLIGTTGPEPNLSGGMVASVAPPFASMRWVVQTQNSYVSQTPFNYSTEYAENGLIYGFMGTRQPAIWMGESAWAGVVPGMTKDSQGVIRTKLEDRVLTRVPGSEVFGAGMYSVDLEIPGGGKIGVNMTATSRVGHFRFVFDSPSSSSEYYPYVFFPTTRPATVFHSPDTFVTTFPNGTVDIYPSNSVSPLEVCGSNDEMLDWAIAPVSIQEAASHFRGWYCARFDMESSRDSIGHGVVQGGQQTEGATTGQGAELGAYIRFASPSNGSSLTVHLRIASSLISADQARINLDKEIGDEFATDVEATRAKTEAAWAEKVGRFNIVTEEGSNAQNIKTVFLTGIFHAMQYPYEIHELREEAATQSHPRSPGDRHYYSAYDDNIHVGDSYSGYSIWDTYRAEWALQILLAPERIPGMIRSMLQDYDEGGWMPMWKNIIETNIMVGTHADSLVAEAVLKGFGPAVESVNGEIEFQATFTDDELTKMWSAAWKDASVPPINDTTTVYSDREEGVDYEVRAGLSTFYDRDSMGWVADDIHSESVSRTLDYAYDDHAVAVLASHLPGSIVSSVSSVPNVSRFLNERASTHPWTVWNPNASFTSADGGKIEGFVQGRNKSGEWADVASGFTEGDRWVYSFAFVHDVAGLIEHRGGNASFVRSLEEFFDGGWVDFTNEPAHHTPYLYALAGAASYTQERVREIATKNYNNTPNGLSGNEDCGQMSAWYIFSAMGFYPVNPVSGEYVVGSPFFSSLSVHLPVPLFVPRFPPHPSLTSSNAFYDKTTDSYTLRIAAPGAEIKPYIKGLKLNGKPINEPIIKHEDIRFGGLLEFEMSDLPESWGGGRGAWHSDDLMDQSGIDQSNL